MENSKNSIWLYVVAGILIIAALGAGYLLGGNKNIPPNVTETPVVTEEPTQEVTVTPTAEVTEEVPEEHGELNTLNKIACPGFLCGVTDNAWNEGWEVWSETSDWPVVMQEFNPQHILGKEQGQWAAGQFVFSNFKEPARFGVKQVFFDLQPGAMYRVNGWGFAYVSDNRPGCGTGLPSCGYATIQLGIDPLGGDDPESESIIWGIENANMLSALNNIWLDPQTLDVYEPTDLYDPYTLTFIALQPVATLYVRIRADYAYPIATVTLDEFDMHAIGWADQFGY